MSSWFRIRQRGGSESYSVERRKRRCTGSRLPIQGPEGGAGWVLKIVDNNSLIKLVLNQSTLSSSTLTRAREEEPFMFKMDNLSLVISSLTPYSQIAQWVVLVINRNVAWFFWASTRPQHRRIMKTLAMIS